MELIIQVGVLQQYYIKIIQPVQQQQMQDGIVQEVVQIQDNGMEVHLLEDVL
jgi:hypothetical protein